MNASPDGNAFHAFEQSGWESNVAEYEAAFERLTTQAVEPLLDAALRGQGLRLLDVATGPGYVAAAAAARGATVTGIDFSAPMVERARKLHPDLDFQLGDAEALAFPGASFDAVVMSFGMLHLARPELAMAEAARVLRPGGRYAFTVWAAPPETAAFALILDAIQAYGKPAVGLPEGPPFFRFSDAAECDRTLRAAGLHDIAVTRVEQVWRFDRPDALFDAIFDGSVRIRAVLRAQSATALDAIRAAVSGAARRYARNGGIELPMPAVLASAVKPL